MNADIALEPTKTLVPIRGRRPSAVVADAMVDACLVDFTVEMHAGLAAEDRADQRYQHGNSEGDETADGQQAAVDRDAWGAVEVNQDIELISGHGGQDRGMIEMTIPDRDQN